MWMFLVLQPSSALRWFRLRLPVPQTSVTTIEPSSLTPIWENNSTTMTLFWVSISMPSIWCNLMILRMIVISRCLLLFLSRRPILSSASDRSIDFGNLSTSKKKMAMKHRERMHLSLRRRRRPMWTKDLRRTTRCSWGHRRRPRTPGPDRSLQGITKSNSINL